MACKLPPALAILIGASSMLNLSAGLRQSLSIFLQPLTRDIAISVAEFALPIAVQNLSWQLLQPLASGLAVRWSFRAIMVRGAVAISRGAC
jgi:hypothetical protein